MPRIFVDFPLAAGQDLLLQGAAARHIQVLRMQPGQDVTVFNGQGGEFSATIERMGRSDVALAVRTFMDREAEALRRVHLLVGAPANERMDWLVEKATELGVASIQPVMTERSVLRLSGERAEKKTAHWQSIAQAACEQCGRNRVPLVHPFRTLPVVLIALPQTSAPKLVLSLDTQADAWVSVQVAPEGADIWLLNGPEGGLSAPEEESAVAAGFARAGLGPRVLRAETAALAALMRALT